MDVSTPTDQVFADKALLNRVIRAVQLDSGTSYMAAYDRVHECATGATLGDALRKLGHGNAAWLTDACSTIERRDLAVERELQRNIDPMVLEESVDDGGRVLLDAARGRRAEASAPDRERAVDVGVILSDPAEFERRLQRIRRVQPQAWDGDDGRSRFRSFDREHAEVGIDSVRTAERPVEFAVARAAAAQVAQRLDSEINECGRERGRLRALEADIARRLSDTTPDARDAATTRVRSEADQTLQPALRLLDALEAGEQPDGEPSSPEVRVLDIPQTDDELRDLIERADRSDIGFVKRLQTYVADGTVPTPAPPPDPSQPPAGVFSGTHDFHKRVLDRVRELDRDPARDYQRTLDEMVNEGRL